MVPGELTMAVLNGGRNSLHRCGYGVLGGPSSHALARSKSELPESLAVPTNPAEHGRKCWHVAAWVDQVLIHWGDQISCSADAVACDYRTSAARSLVHNNRERFILGGQGHDVRCRVDAWKLRLILKSQESHVFADPQV